MLRYFASIFARFALVDRRPIAVFARELTGIGSFRAAAEAALPFVTSRGNAYKSLGKSVYNVL